VTGPPCNTAGCPVANPDGDLLRRIRSTVIEHGTVLRRGHQQRFRDATQMVPGVGDTRFAPLPDTHHVYLAQTSVAALLESALHDLVPGHGRIRAAQLTLWAESAVALARQVRLIDLRDAELHRLGLQRDQLVSTSAAHYPCTRRFAAALRGRPVGGHPTDGVVWSSRQVELQAAALQTRPAVRELMTTAPADVLVLWQPPNAATPLDPVPDGIGPLDRGPGLHFVIDLAATLGIPIL
jgi:hypothetical protein